MLTTHAKIQQIVLQGNFNSAFGSRGSLVQSWQHVRNIIPWMSVQASPQSLLIKIMCNQTDTAAEYEQSVEDTHLEVVLGLLRRESATVAEQVDKADSNTAVDVKDQVVLLGGRHLFNSQGIIEQLGGRESLLGELLDELNAEIGVVSGLDFVANSRDCFDLC
jgi:hypothetical protein